MRPLTIAIVLILLGGSVEAQSAPKLTRLDFMAGCWEGQLGKDDIVEEIWTTPTETMLLATTRYLNGKREATGWEFTRIVSDSTGVAFVAASNGRPEDRYALTVVSSEYVAFENREKSFPQHISYRRVSDGSLIARNEGEGQLSVEVRFRRVRCPGERR